MDQQERQQEYLRRKRVLREKRRKEQGRNRVITMAVVITVIISFGWLTASTIFGAPGPLGIFGGGDAQSNNNNKPQTTAMPTPMPTNLVAVDAAKTEHIFFHPLIVYPDKAFYGNSVAKGFDDFFVTVPEFKKILQSLYDKNFILVNLADVLTANTGSPSSTASATGASDKKVKMNTFMLPAGKKPLVISVDDLNYYEYMIKNGCNQKLVFDENGEIAALVPAHDGVSSPTISRDTELVPILDDFVKEHPDFSWQGAKMCLAETGYAGTLGYRTQADSPNRAAEIEAVKPIIQKLKDTGWYFASHGYGHLDAAKQSATTLSADTKQWCDEVGTLVGPTPLYIYPYGAFVKPNLDTGATYQSLTNEGFTVLAGVGNNAYYKLQTNSVITQRWHIDGIAFKQQPEQFKIFFDSQAIMDPARPK